MNRLKNEWCYFWTAVMFFTRIPIPFRLDYSDEIMNRSQKYYAWVGLLVGIFGALIYFLSQLIFGFPIAIILSIISTVLFTGAFHEDGFTDVCDSFGGGYGKEKILTIMKDSRIGAYGTIGIILLLLLKFYTLLELSTIVTVKQVVILYIFAHSSSRFVAGTAIYTHLYVRDIDSSKIKPIAAKPLPINSLLIGVFGALLPVIVTQEWKLLLSIPVAYLSKVYLCWYFKKHIGGYTGDALGTIQQVAEIIIYLSMIVVWKYI